MWAATSIGGLAWTMGLAMGLARMISRAFEQESEVHLKALNEEREKHLQAVNLVRVRGIANVEREKCLQVTIMVRVRDILNKEGENSFRSRSGTLQLAPQLTRPR